MCFVVFKGRKNGDEFLVSEGKRHQSAFTLSADSLQKMYSNTHE